MCFMTCFASCAKKRGVSPTRATVEIGLSRTIGTKWKTTGATPQGETLSKIADYFGVSVDYLLGNEPKEKTPAEADVTFDDFTYAMYGEAKELTDEDKNMLLEMARMLKKRQQEGK